MAEFRAPTRDIRFIINEVLQAQSLAELPGFEDFEQDTSDAIVEEIGRFARDVIEPLNRSGDEEGARLTDAGVVAPKGFGDAYQQYVEAGWNSVVADPEFGGMGLPEIIGSVCQDMWAAANMSFGLAPILSAGAVECLETHGSDDQKQTYLHKMVSGEWTGTMDLTEPQAGSDLAAVRTKAEPDGDQYRIFGQKIYISWGEHDMAENIVHLVLARLPDAPAGVKGISLFIVPRFLVNEDGSLGERNDMRCSSLEHKMGIHASPTCTMTYGDDKGAVGYLVGEANKGLSYMFTMMNEARHKVGIQGLGIGEAAYQRALYFAKDRVQGKPLDPAAGEGASIIYHPDVRRMLFTMGSLTTAMRLLNYDVARLMDVARLHPDEQVRADTQARVDLLIPISKAWSTEIGIEVASTGMQVHGGMGFVEETGAAQYLRDARITAIYEGTNGIQAQDLVGRKLLRDGGTAMASLLSDLTAACDAAQQAGGVPADLAGSLAAAVDQLKASTDAILAAGKDDPGAAMANSFHYMMQMGYVVGAEYMLRQAVRAKAALDEGTDETPFYEAKMTDARFYITQVLPRSQACAAIVAHGAEPVMSSLPAAFA
ncbi:MAG: acyl-CoA dehydrogenase [Salinisphaeraceae bacterium]|nr:acyl-CoA dehydrogenase [Salinisphaeraceae bacterium]